MPRTTEKKFFDSAIDLDPEGAGGEPPGEPPATPSSTRQRSKPSTDRVGDAVDRARLREMAKRTDRERISDEVIDELLAGAQTEQEIAGPGGLLAQLSGRSLPGEMPCGASGIGLVEVDRADLQLDRIDHPQGRW